MGKIIACFKSSIAFWLAALHKIYAEQTLVHEKFAQKFTLSV
jgi:hypothetical protein